MPGTITPWFRQQFFDANGDPLAAGSVETYEAGTSTPLATYSDSALSVSNGTTITLNSAGFPQVTGVEVAIFLLPRAYKFILKNSAGTVQRTIDNVYALQAASSVNLEIDGVAGVALVANDAVYLSDGSGALTAGRWYKADADLTYGGPNPVLGFVVASIAIGATGLIRRAGIMDGFAGLVAGSTYYVSATAGAITSTAPNPRRSVGVANTTTSIAIDFAPRLPDLQQVQTTTSTGSVNDVALTQASRGILRCNNASLLTFTGFAAAQDGDTWDIVSIGAGQVDLANQNTGSVVGNRIITGPTATISLAPGVGRCRIVYDLTTARWRVVEHEQGAYITPTFAAGSFTASSGTWTVAGGDVNTHAYYLKGRQLQFVVDLSTTDVSATPTSLLVALPGGFIAAKNVRGFASYQDAGGSSTLGNAIVTAAGTTVAIQHADAAAWSIAAGSTYIRLNIVIEVQ